MGTGSVVGQAAGTAAAICARSGCLPAELTSTQVSEIQQLLLRDDQYIPGLPGADPADLARRAAVSATSSAPACGPQAVLDGWTRELAAESHEWRSAPGAVLPQRLELAWSQPVDMREVHLTFDTGFARPLAHTQYDYLAAKMILGPQPETVRDYDLLVLTGGVWRELLQVRGNYQRKRVHVADASGVEALRVVILATNGTPEARVFEVRVY
jgi:hypothetical protein